MGNAMRMRTITFDRIEVRKIFFCCFVIWLGCIGWIDAFWEWGREKAICWHGLIIVRTNVRKIICEIVEMYEYSSGYHSCMLFVNYNRLHVSLSHPYHLVFKVGGFHPRTALFASSFSTSDTHSLWFGNMYRPTNHCAPPPHKHPHNRMHTAPPTQFIPYYTSQYSFLSSNDISLVYRPGHGSHHAQTGWYGGALKIL